MLLDYANVKTETNCNLSSTAFTINKSPIAFDILSSKLYSNIHLAIVRELLCNAYDSQIANGNPNTSIDIKFPSIIDNEFYIRDYGTGMSKKDILTLYTSFFSSTKNNSNDFTGCFGLGSKTPFAYTDIFNVTSFYNGMCDLYVATKKDGFPSIIPLSSTPTKEPNGLKISFNTQENQGLHNGEYDSTFLAEFLKYIVFIPEIKINYINDNSSLNDTKNKHVSIINKNNITLYKNDDTIYNTSYNKLINDIYIKQGQNIYKINDFIDIPELSLNFITYIGYIVIEVPIGTLEILPNRENLSNNTNNLNILAKLILEVDNVIKDNHSSIITLNSVFFEKFLETTYFIDKENCLFHTNIKYNNYACDTISIKPYCLSGMEFKFNSFEKTYLNSYTRDTNLKLNIKENNKILILLSYCNYYGNKNFTTATTIHKLENIIQQHNLKNEYDNIYILDYKFCDNLKTLKTTKYMLNSLKQLNTIPEFNNDINYMSIKKFYKLYPIKKIKNKQFCCTENKNIRYSYTTLNKTHCNNDLMSLDFIQNTYLTKNTVIINNDDYNTEIFYDVKYMLALNHKVHLTDFNSSILYKYIKNKYPNNIDLLNNLHYDTLNFLIINKSNIKYFKKDYAILSLYDLFDYIEKDNTKYKVTFYTDNGKDNLTELIRYKNTILLNYRKIINTNKKIFNTLLNNIDNIMSYYKKDSYYIYTNTYDYNKHISNNLELKKKFILYDDKTIKNFNKLDILKNLVNYKHHRYYNNNTNLSYYSLDSFEKTYLLEQLRKENKNVLFFNR